MRRSSFPFALTVEDLEMTTARTSWISSARVGAPCPLRKSGPCSSGWGISRCPKSLFVSLGRSCALQRVVERRECCLALLPPQMFGRLRTYAGSAAGDRGHRPYFATGRVHPPLQVGFTIFLKKNNSLAAYNRMAGGGGVDGRKGLLKNASKCFLFFREKTASISKREPSVNQDNSRKLLVNVEASRPVCF